MAQFPDPSENDVVPRARIAQILADYAATIDERTYPDAVAALLRFRSKLLAGAFDEARAGASQAKLTEAGA